MRVVLDTNVVTHLAAQGIRVLSDIELLQLLRNLPPAHRSRLIAVLRSGLCLTPPR